MSPHREPQAGKDFMRRTITAAGIFALALAAAVGCCPSSPGMSPGLATGMIGGAGTTGGAGTAGGGPALGTGMGRPARGTGAAGGAETR
jgi:hypothetical protein